MTFSFNDNYEKLLRKVYWDVYEIYGINNWNYIGMDPSISNHYFHGRIEAILQYLKETYGLVDYYIRYEF